MKTKVRSHKGRMGRPIVAKPVSDCTTLDEVYRKCMPAFGGQILGRFYAVLREMIRRQIPTVITIAGPMTISDQHRGWLMPLMRLLNVTYIDVTDAIVYHDGHDSLSRTKRRVIREVNMHGSDEAYRRAKIIRVTNTGFKEPVLFNQDRMISAIMRRKEFQRPMTTTERNNILGKYYHAQELKAGVKPGLLSFCHGRGIPVFMGAPADGSTFLNIMKLKALAQIDGKRFDFAYDLAADVFEACAYHLWGLRKSDQKSLGILILGGGVAKNYGLQPEPALSQIFGIEDVKGYDFDVQMVSVPQEFGCLTGAPPAEAHAWGKLSLGALKTGSASVVEDYSRQMPQMVWALEQVFTPVGVPLRLFHRREELVADLMKVVAEKRPWLLKTLKFPLAYKGKD